MTQWLGMRADYSKHFFLFEADFLLLFIQLKQLCSQEK